MGTRRRDAEDMDGRLAARRRFTNSRRRDLARFLMIWHPLAQRRIIKPFGVMLEGNGARRRDYELLSPVGAMLEGNGAHRREVELVLPVGAMLE